ncbi:MAG TPA: hypothetical protein VGH10_03165 [Actinomycetota bacterium]
MLPLIGTELNQARQRDIHAALERGARAHQAAARAAAPGRGQRFAFAIASGLHRAAHRLEAASRPNPGRARELGKAA